MTELIGAIFGTKKSAPPQLAAPLPVETKAQTTQDQLVKAEQEREVSQAKERSQVITRASAGPQTLFKRSDAIPQAVKLGGGRREV